MADYEAERSLARAQEHREVRKSIIVALALTFVILAGVLVGCPQYKVYKQGKDGEAALKRAESEKLTQLEEAKANLASEDLNAQAEVVRAKGAAEAIGIEDGQLTERYIQYLWVRSTAGDSKQTIYIPTEGNLPILEGNPAFRQP